MLLIADEVMTGFGRTGRMFGSETYGIEPDLVTLAKGLTSAYVPLSAVVVGEKVAEVLEQATDRLGAFSHGYTYRATRWAPRRPTPCSTSSSARTCRATRRARGAQFQERLRETFADHPLVGEVRAWA